MTNPDPTGQHAEGGGPRPTAQEQAEQLLAHELSVEQAHVDRVYAELEKAAARADLVATEGMSRGRTDRTGDVRDEEVAGLFARDALVYSASRRRSSLDRQHEGLVFGRLDLDHPAGQGRSTAATGREVRYIGRLGVRDDDYEPLVIDWRAPAASPFYRATPVEPMDVVRRRVLRCRGMQVIGLEDDLMVAEAPDDLPILGDGALMAALTRSRSGRMRDIVATIQGHQDEAIRASARGVTEITGGPGTGKTVVALHRAAYLLYSDRRKFESGGILVVGPSSAYTAYIERVLPSLGEDSVALRSLGDVLEAVTATRVDAPDVAHTKGSLRIRRVLSRAARDVIPGAPEELRTFVDGRPVRLGARELASVRSDVLRRHHRNSSRDAMLQALAQAAWAQVREGERDEFMDRFTDHLEVDAFLREWWRPVDPREVLLWLADPQRCRRYARGVLGHDEADALSASMRVALDTGTWSVADVACIDDLAARLGVVPDTSREERGFYEIELLDDAEAEAIASGRLRGDDLGMAGDTRSTGSARGYRERALRDDDADREARLTRLMRGRIDRPGEYAHVLVDEAQDLSPMQWRMIGRRGRWASWTVVGDAAQASWPDAHEAALARDEAFGSQPRAHFHMTTNYRNAREIFEHAAHVIREAMPDADIPDAVRETGVQPVDRVVPADRLVRAVEDSVRALADEVEGIIAVITPDRWAPRLAHLDGDRDGGSAQPQDLRLGDRLVVIDPLSTKGLEYDATVVVDPDGIVADTAGGARTLYVVLTRAAHRMHVLRVS